MDFPQFPSSQSYDLDQILPVLCWVAGGSPPCSGSHNCLMWDPLQWSHFQPRCYCSAIECKMCEAGRAEHLILTFLVRNSVIYGHSEVGLYMCFICCITYVQTKTTCSYNVPPLDGVFVTICAWRGNCLPTGLVNVCLEYIATSKAALRCNHRPKHIWAELKNKLEPVSMCCVLSRGKSVLPNLLKQGRYYEWQHAAEITRWSLCW